MISNRLLKKLHLNSQKKALKPDGMVKAYTITAASLLLSVQAQSFEFDVGGIEGTLDSQISVGSSWRVEGQDSQRADDIIGSNQEDGNRNFKKGDTFSQVFKGTHDLGFSYKNVGGFVRGKYWYDSALENQSVENGHTPTSTVAGGPTGSALTYDDKSQLDDSNFNSLSKLSGVTLLDAFIYGEFEVMDMPVDVRLGRQVLSWGESTFIFGGINAINPVDINAFLRPGSEIKEGLLPVNMLYSSVGLTDSLSAEAFYQLEFQETVTPGCGTYFSTNDFISQGCDRISLVDGAFSLSRNEDGIRKASDDGQYGLALHYVSEALADTEFGLYFMNIHSRAPVVSAVKGAGWVNGVDLVTQDRVVKYMSPPYSLDLAGAKAAATKEAQGLSLAANSQTGSYMVSYPEDMQLVGVSFAANIAGVALSGEINHKKGMPVQIDDTQMIGVSLTGMSTSPELMAAAAAVPAGGVFEGFRLFDVSQAQMTAIAFLDRMAGASQIVLVGEVGYTFVHGFDDSDDAIIFSRPAIFDGKDGGTMTESSWGYRARLMADYSDVFAGVNLKPILAWSEDVEGFAPQPGGAFKEGQQSMAFTLEADYLSTYSASISYTQFMGGDYSMVNDRDFAAVSLGMQF